MKALLKKTRKNQIKMNFKELYNLAEKYCPNKIVYVKTPYYMTKHEFLSQYEKYFLILPSMPSWDDLREGIKSCTFGHNIVKFFV